MYSPKKFLFVAFYLISSSIAYADTALIEDEIQVVERLVATTQKQLQAQRELMDRMQQFKHQKERFASGQESKTLVLEMVTTAARILDLITTNHLQHLFSSTYLEELKLFSSIAAKKTRSYEGSPRNTSP